MIMCTLLGYTQYGVVGQFMHVVVNVYISILQVRVGGTTRDGISGGFMGGVHIGGNM